MISDTYLLIWVECTHVHMYNIWNIWISVQVENTHTLLCHKGTFSVSGHNKRGLQKLHGKCVTWKKAWISTCFCTEIRLFPPPFFFTFSLRPLVQTARVEMGLLLVCLGTKGRREVTCRVEMRLSLAAAVGWLLLCLSSLGSSSLVPLIVFPPSGEMESLQQLTPSAVPARLLAYFLFLGKNISKSEKGNKDVRICCAGENQGDQSPLCNSQYPIFSCLLWIFRVLYDISSPVRIPDCLIYQHVLRPKAEPSVQETLSKCLLIW